MASVQFGVAAAAVQDRMFAALAVLRAVLLLNVGAMTWNQWDNFEHRSAALVVVGIVVAWSGMATWLLAAARRRRAWVFAVDFGVAVTALLLGPHLKGEDFQASLVGFWIAAPLLACAVQWRTVGGVLAGLGLGACDLLVRSQVSSDEWGNVFLLLVAGAVVGHLSGEVQRMAEDQARAERLAAAAQERTRLSRVVHDGVLQVLAMVARRGAEAGREGPDHPESAAEWTALGVLAGQQEVALRGLVNHGAPFGQRPDDRRARGAGDDDLGQRRGRTNGMRHAAVRQVDLMAELATGRALQAPRLPLEIHLSGPGHEVLLAPGEADELTAVVLETLANVRTHVGVEAPAWVLVEQTPKSVVVSVRDEGPGITEERLAQAQLEGRLGVASSIRGRIADLGGVAALTSDRWGTEWEFTVPRSPVPRNPVQNRPTP